MAFCPTAPSHYLNQCWFFHEWSSVAYTWERLHSEDPPLLATILHNEVENYTFYWYYSHISLGPMSWSNMHIHDSPTFLPGRSDVTYGLFGTTWVFQGNHSDWCSSETAQWPVWPVQGGSPCPQWNVLDVMTWSRFHHHWPFVRESILCSSIPSTKK